MHFTYICFYLTNLDIIAWTVLLSERERLCLSKNQDTDEELQDKPSGRASQGPIDSVWRDKLYGPYTPLWVDAFWIMFCNISFFLCMRYKTELLESRDMM